MRELRVNNTINHPKPRILELEHFLGVREEVEKFAVHATKVRNYDPKDPHHVIKKYEMVEEIPTTPAFPIVSSQFSVLTIFDGLNATRIGSCINHTSISTRRRSEGAYFAFRREDRIGSRICRLAAR